MLKREILGIKLFLFWKFKVSRRSVYKKWLDLRFRVFLVFGEYRVSLSRDRIVTRGFFERSFFRESCVFGRIGEGFFFILNMF